MSFPIILLVGQAGSGKDTAAGIIAKNHNAAVLAQADPMKRFVMKVLRFSEDQLWGPSSYRNAPDPRFGIPSYVNDCLDRLAEEAFDWIVEIWPGNGPHDQAIDELKRWGFKLFKDALIEKHLTPRKALQTLGTEFGRTLSKNIWADYAANMALKLLGGDYVYSRTVGWHHTPGASCDFVVITDGRFRNELISVKKLGGRIFQILAPDSDGSSAEAAGVKGHASETEQRSLPSHWYDAVILNDKRFGFDALEEVLDEAIQYTFYHPNLFEPVESIIEKSAQQ